MHEMFHGKQLIDRGYIGSVQDVWAQWLKSKGVAGETIADLEDRYLTKAGISPGSLNDRRFSLYRSQGLNGTLDDMANKWTVPEGGDGPNAGDPIPDDMWDDVVFFQNYETKDAIIGGIGTLLSSPLTIVDDGLFGTKSGQFAPSSATIRTGVEYSVEITLDSTVGFTIDTWGKTIDLGPAVFPTWIQLYQSTNSNNMVYCGSSDQRGFTFGGDFGFVQSPNTGIPHDRWSHAAVVVGNGSKKLYDDGVEVASSAVPTLTRTYDRLIIGSRISNNLPFKGKLDETRITTGVRWTTAFTPPTGPVLVP